MVLRKYIHRVSLGGGGGEGTVCLITTRSTKEEMVDEKHYILSKELTVLYTIHYQSTHEIFYRL